MHNPNFTQKDRFLDKSTILWNKVDIVNRFDFFHKGYDSISEGLVEMLRYYMYFNKYRIYSFRVLFIVIYNVLMRLASNETDII